jgi:N-acetylglucosaminyl-diphospho-decaprenol L-rhamnosyltransferase
MRPTPGGGTDEGGPTPAASGEHRGAVILGYGPSDLANVVDVLVRAGIPRHHVIVVHQPDGTGREMTSVGCPGALVENTVNTGYGAGMNLGLGHLPGSVGVILLLTPGVDMGAAALADAFDLVDDEPCIGILAPVLHDPSGATLSCGGLMSPTFRPYHSRDFRHAGKTAGSAPLRRADWVDGAAVLVRRQVGPLPEEYFLYWEDVAYSLRAARAGWLVGVDERWSATTLPGTGGRRDLFRYLFWRNRILCSRAWGNPATTVASLVALGAAAVLRPGQLMVSGDLRGARRTAAVLFRALRDASSGRSGPPPPSVTGGSDVSVGQPTSRPVRHQRSGGQR